MLPFWHMEFFDATGNNHFLTLQTRSENRNIDCQLLMIGKYVEIAV